MNFIILHNSTELHSTDGELMQKKCQEPEKISSQNMGSVNLWGPIAEQFEHS